MIKGHTKIELTNEENGEVTVVEEDNMITNGFRDMFVPLCGIGTFQGAGAFYGVSDGIDSYKRRRSVIDCMLGGVLLFRDRQEENVDNFLPEGINEITGRGTTYAYTDADTILGSYNIQESGRQEDGSYKKVWDFSTNQANGIINSISLTTDVGGAFGNGSLIKDLTGVSLIPNSYPLNIYPAVGAQNQASWNVPSFDWSILGLTTEGSPANNICYVDGDANKIVFIKSMKNVFYGQPATAYFYNTGTLTFLKVRFPLTKISPFLEPSTLEEFEEATVSIPEAVMSQCNASNNCMAWYYDDGYLYFVMHAASVPYVRPNEVLKILKIKAVDFTTEVISVTNTTSTVIGLSGSSASYLGYLGTMSSGYNGGAMHITNDYLFFNSVKDGVYNYDSKIYRIDLKNNTKVDVVNFDGVDFVGDPTLIDSYSSALTGRVRVRDYLYLSNNKKECFVLNIKSNTIRRCVTPDGTGIPFDVMQSRTYSYNTICPVCSTHKNLNFMINITNYQKRCLISPFFIPQTLMTINNLSEPIVKTASSSMKVTYTLSETSEEPPTNTEPVNEP